MNSNIDFEYASREWNKNKLKLDNGCYKYICLGITKNNNICKKKPKKYTDYCHIHKP